MDCTKIQSDIEKLESLRDSLSSSLSAINETGKGRINAKANQKQAQALEDELLQNYLQDFAEKNPDLLSWQLGEKIEGFDGHIESIALLPDGGALVGGEDGELRVCSRDPDGNWKLSEEIEGFDSYINSIAPLSDGGALVGGGYSELRVCSRDPDGNWKLSEEKIGRAHV